VNSPKRQRVVVGMSGGVDSSATAALLLEQGYEVIGITLKLWPQDCVNRAEDKCCGPQAVTDARAVCHKLGVPYYLIDESAEFQKHVISYFADEYKAGRTPNPCVLCNQNLKFGRLIDRADQLGAQFIATGHFARVERVGSSRREEAHSNFGKVRASLRRLLRGSGVLIQFACLDSPAAVICPS
jgi:tRNA-specific 2-thiouridylase